MGGFQAAQLGGRMVYIAKHSVRGQNRRSSGRVWSDDRGVPVSVPRARRRSEVSHGGPTTIDVRVDFVAGNGTDRFRVFSAGENFRLGGDQPPTTLRTSLGSAFPELPGVRRAFTLLWVVPGLVLLSYAGFFFCSHFTPRRSRLLPTTDTIARSTDPRLFGGARSGFASGGGSVHAGPVWLA